MSRSRFRRDHDDAPPRYGRRILDDAEEEQVPTLHLAQAAGLSGVSQKTIGHIAGDGLTLPPLVILAGGQLGWRGREHVAAVRRWCELIRHPTRLSAPAGEH